MRDVSAKVFSFRRATAQSVVRVSPSTIETILAGKAPKGDPFPVARVAAIQAVKNAPQLMPYCHTMPIEHVEVNFDTTEDTIITTVSVKSSYRTGVEMEAMAGASVAALNFYDMMKLIDDDMVIERVELLSKSGGKTDFRGMDGYNAGVVVVSDSVSNGKSEDRSGRVLVDGLKQHGAAVVEFEVVPDDLERIQSAISGHIEAGAKIILTTGGTGLGPRDLTPEAVSPMFTQVLPGVVAMLQNYSLERLPLAMLSRLTAGRIGNVIVVCLPGSPGACQDGIACLFPYLLHAFDVMGGARHES